MEILINLVIGAVALFALIAFFSMSSGIEKLVKLSSKQIQQNDAIIKLLKGDKLTEEDLAKLGDAKQVKDYRRLSIGQITKDKSN